MKILTVSDEVLPTIYHVSIRERLRDVDLIVGCGDLPPSYLEYIISTLDKPCFFVPGNHDGEPEHTESGPSLTQPRGGIDLDGRVIKHGGLVLAGLGGSLWYNGGKNQYSQTAMAVRLSLMLPRILWHRRRNGYGIDLFVAHAPPAGINDSTGVHAGFRAFRWLIERYPPRFFVHGHLHRNYRMNVATDTRLAHTQVINTAGYRVLDVPVLAGRPHARYNGHANQ